MKRNYFLSVLLFILLINLIKIVEAQKEKISNSKTTDEIQENIISDSKATENNQDTISDTKATENNQDGISDTTATKNNQNNKIDRISNAETNETEKISNENNKTGEENKTEEDIIITTDINEEEETEKAEKLADKIEVKDEENHLIADLWESYSTDMIFAKVYCLYNREKQCKIFFSQMINILKKIEKAIDIKKEIRMSLYLVDLTYLCEDCLSIVLPPSFIYVQESGSNKIYSVPQALAKQLNIKGFSNIEDQLPNEDFTMVVNVDQEDDDIKQFGEFTLIREILHGMGMITSGDLVNSNSYYLYEDDFYAPQRAPIISFDDSDINGVYVKFEKFYPISIFEKYIVTQNDPNNYIFNDLNDMYMVRFPKQSYNFMNATEEEEKQSLLDSYEPFRSSSYYEPARKIAQLYKQKGTVGFKTVDGTIVPLQTFDDEYIKSSSIIHIDIPKMSNYSFYDYDPFNKKEIQTYLNEDFILNYTYMFAYDVDTILSIVGKNNKHGFLSPNIIKILTTLGWTEKGSKSSSTNNAVVNYEIANNVKIEYDNYWDALMKASDQHDYYGYGFSFADNLVCDAKAYAMTFLAVALALGL